MNISEFERSKPRKTYGQILKLEEYVNESEANKKHLDTQKVKEILHEIKLNFLRGE